jgi:hypothetical protein
MGWALGLVTGKKNSFTVEGRLGRPLAGEVGAALVVDGGDSAEGVGLEI